MTFSCTYQFYLISLDKRHFHCNYMYVVKLGITSEQLIEPEIVVLAFNERQRLPKRLCRPKLHLPQFALLWELNMHCVRYYILHAL